MVSKSPVWLLGLPPVVEAEHDGKGAGRQQLPFVLVLLVLVVQTVSCCQGKSIANLFDNDGHPTNQKVCCIGWFGTYQHTAALAVDIARFDVLIT